jgi:hypothetical protein
MPVFLQYIFCAILIACVIGLAVSGIGVIKCNIDLEYNRYGGYLLNRLGAKNSNVKTQEILDTIQIKADIVYTLEEVRWLLQDATEQEFLDSLPEQLENAFVDLNFSNNGMYRVLHRASKMFGEDCLKYGTSVKVLNILQNHVFLVLICHIRE